MKPDPNSPAGYDLASVRVPAMRGRALQAMAGMLRSPLRGVLVRAVAAKFGLPAFRRMRLEESPVLQPIHHAVEAAEAGARIPQAEWPEGVAQHSPGFRFSSVSDYAAAY